MNRPAGRIEGDKIHGSVPGTGWVWLLGFACLLLAAAVYVYQAMTPSDGARIAKGFEAWTAEGVIVHAYPGAGGLLKDGDLVLAIDGVELEDWAEALFQPGNAVAGGDAARRFSYRILRNEETVELLIEPLRQPFGEIAVENWGVILFAVVFQILAAYVFARRPEEPAALAMFLWGMTSSHFYVWSSYLQIFDLINEFGFWLYTFAGSFLWLANWGALMHLALTFPRQLPIAQKRPFLLVMPYLASFGLYSLLLAISWPGSSSRLEWIGGWQRWEALIPVALFLPSIAIIVGQYLKVADEASRKKVRWVVFSGVIAGGLTIFFYLIPNLLGLPGLDSNLLGLIILLFPISIAIAILRYQLFDIDVIIRRTLVYGLLTATLVVIYFGSVILLQQLFEAATGERSQAAIVFSTLVIAALFSPLRRRIQDFIDRRFYRRQYNAELILQAFSATTVKEVDLDRLRDHLLQVVNETFQPEQVSLWIREPGEKQADKSQ